MGCSSCGQKARNVAKAAVTPMPIPSKVEPVKEVVETPIMAAKSASDKLVHLRYKGGGMAAKRSPQGCKTCGGSRSRYQVVTMEQIMFVSEDAPNGIFKQTVSVGHDYYVTEEQAKILLAMEYKDLGGKVKHKFEEIK